MIANGHAMVLKPRVRPLRGTEGESEGDASSRNAGRCDPILEEGA